MLPVPACITYRTSILTGDGRMGAAVEIKMELSHMEKLVKALQNGAVAGFHVGVVSGATNGLAKGRVEIATYAAYNEFGTSRIPPRPFLGISAQRYGKKWVDIVAAGLQGIAKAADPEKVIRDAFLGAGRIATGDVQTTIKSNIQPDNAPRYKRYKEKLREENGGGYSGTLVLSGDMLDAIGIQLVDAQGNMTP